MKIQGERRLDFPRQQVWEALMDPQVLAGTLPGCRSLERDGDDAFSGRLQVSIGPVKGDFRGRLSMTDVEPPESYRMRLDGRGPSGFMRGEGTVGLAQADGGAATLLSYDLEAQVGGRIAGLGQRLLESSGKAVAQQGLDGLERQLAAAAGEGAGAGTGAEAAEEPADAETGEVGAQKHASEAGGGPSPGRRAAAEAPSQAGFALGVAGRMARDLVPPEARPWAIFLAGVILGVILGGRRR